MTEVDTETFLRIYTILMQFLVVESIVVWLIFSFGAPWYKYQAGWTIWGLLGSIAVIFVVFVLRQVFGEFPFRRELVLITLSLLPLALGLVGISVICARRKRIERRKLIEFEKEMKNPE